MTQQVDLKEKLAKDLESLANKIRSGEIMPERYSTGWEPKYRSIHGASAFKTVTFELEYIDFGGEQ